MSKKKIILSLFIGFLLLFTAFCCYKWSRNKATGRALAWIKSQDGYIGYNTPDWVTQWPQITQGAIKKSSAYFYPARPKGPNAFYHRGLSLVWRLGSRYHDRAARFA